MAFEALDKYSLPGYLTGGNSNGSGGIRDIFIEDLKDNMVSCRAKECSVYEMFEQRTENPSLKWHIMIISKEYELGWCLVRDKHILQKCRPTLTDVTPFSMMKRVSTYFQDVEINRYRLLPVSDNYKLRYSSNHEEYFRVKRLANPFESGVSTDLST